METSRLSRHSDAPILRDGKPFELEPNDDDVARIFAHFSRYRYLRPDTIAALNGGNIVATRRRMKLLTRQPNNFLYIPDDFYQQPFPNSRYQIYAPDHKGETLLKDEGLWREDRFGDEKLFAHSMLVCDVISSLQVGVQAAQHKMVWFDDIRLSPRFPKATLDRKRPASLSVSIRHRHRNGSLETLEYDYTNDSHGPFGVDFGGGFNFFSLEAENKAEVERPTLERPSFLKKFLSMQEIEARKLYRTQWGIPNLRHLVVCTNQHDVERRKALIMQLTEGKGSPHVAFAVYPSIHAISNPPRPTPELYTRPWQRAGYPDLFINQPYERR